MAAPAGPPAETAGAECSEEALAAALADVPELARLLEAPPPSPRLPRGRGRQAWHSPSDTHCPLSSQAGQRSWLSGRAQRNGQNEFYGQAHPTDQRPTAVHQAGGYAAGLPPPPLPAWPLARAGQVRRAERRGD